ncbi:MAG: hypothetical protein DRP01_03675 [Archaeoglobales archaeon]|nr:MAG: hypothetical protein DRP01_03675 [Archaeoglobales archaeon]
MSNLNSKFDVIAGLPPQGKSTMDSVFKQKDAESPILIEGRIAKVVDESSVPVLTALTSTAVSAITLPDVPWLVYQGMDQSDAVLTDKMAALRLNEGLIFKVETSESFTIGDLVRADAGVVKPLTGANERAIGQIIGKGDGFVVIAS